MIGRATDVKIDYDVPETFNMASVLVDKHVEEGRGDRVAYYCGDETITYRELQRRVNQAGNMLRNHGIEIEDRVILLMKDRPQFIETYIGAMKIGAVPVPIDIRSAPDRVAYYVSDSRATAAVVDGDLLPSLGLEANSFRYLKQVYVVGGTAPSPQPSPPQGGRGSSHLALVETFSGSWDSSAAPGVSRGARPLWRGEWGVSPQPHLLLSPSPLRGGGWGEGFFRKLCLCLLIKTW